MQNLKQQGNLSGTKRPRCPKPLYIGAKAFMKAAMRGDAFLIYVFPSPNVKPCPYEIPSEYQEFKYLKRKMRTPCLNINHMSMLLILWKEHNLHLDPSTICHKMNL